MIDVVLSPFRVTVRDSSKFVQLGPTDMWSFSAISSAVITVLLLVVVHRSTVVGNELRIVGGFPALQESTMHQVSIRRKTNDQASYGSGHMCGGSLINNRTVLTAAHCLVNDSNQKRAASYFRVVGGNVNRTVVSANTEILDVSQVIIHGSYNPSNLDNDVGLLILSSVVPASHATLRPIALVTSRPSPGVVCQVSGWGTTQYNVAIATTVLMAVNVTIKSTEICNGTSSYNGFIKSGMVCAGDDQGGKDACQGDSGGPLVCNGNLAGIVSNGQGCGLANYPGIYADVAYYREWILKNGANRAIAGMSIPMLVVGLIYGFIQRLVI